MTLASPLSRTARIAAVGVYGAADGTLSPIHSVAAAHLHSMSIGRFSPSASRQKNRQFGIDIYS
jgi:hypothetical protein